MCFGTFISPIFIQDTGMLYFGGGRKNKCRLKTGIKIYESCREKFKEKVFFQ